MNQTIYQVDAFTDRAFGGNPAAVCILPEARSAEWMQAVAGEMNLSETAFLVERGDAYDLRWFTPAVEVDLCGHATLASAHILWETGAIAHDATACFDTRSGRLTAQRNGDWITLDFPATPPVMSEPLEGLAEALGAPVTAMGRSRFDILVELDNAAAVRGLKPDFGQIGRLDVRGVIVTSRSDSSEYDFISRFFAPAAGVPEDPATGSAHCCLGPYWVGRLGKTDFLAYQASTRGGILKVVVQDDRVLLGGQAVTVMRGELL